MLLSHIKRLCVPLVLIITASPSTAAPTITSPSSFADAVKASVPPCAQSCLLASLEVIFPVVCTSQPNIQCLCSRYGNSGETLGEVSVACVYSSCQSLDQIGSAYNICLGQQEAVRPTKTALTITTAINNSPSTTSRTTTLSPEGATTTSNPSPRSSAYSSKTALVDSISSVPTATATATAATSSSPLASAEESSPKMTPAQIAGLCVAAVAAFVMAIGLMALSVCLRRRRERKFEITGDEKSQYRESLPPTSHYVSAQRSQPALPKELPMLPLPVHMRRHSKVIMVAKGPLEGAKTIRPVQRNGVGTSDSSSSLSLPLDQIGVAISAELDGKPLVPGTSVQSRSNQGRSMNKPAQNRAPLRPVSSLTQDTVFEEDDDMMRRRSSILLPTPPVPIPPIRKLQTSKQLPHPKAGSAKLQRGSELFLNIPIRHQRPQPRRIDRTNDTPAGLGDTTAHAKRPRLGPAIQLTSTSSSVESKAHTQSSQDGSHDGDIIDYYLHSQQGFASKAYQAQQTKPKIAPNSIQITPKKSLSTASRTISRSSSNIRDSVSSQTSFETSDPNDTTPEDDDEGKQLSEDKQQLSPVVESPIAGIKYPKVPRSSNQLVPRSPRSPPNDNKWPQKQRSPRHALEPSTLLSKRDNALPPLLLESRPRLNSPHRDPFVSPPRKNRAHIRSASTDSWTMTPATKIDRKSKVQSGVFGKSPVMYEADLVKPLNIRRNRDEMQEINIGRDVAVDSEGLKSPIWIPHLTPTRKGEDLFISVGWGDSRR